MRINNSKDNQKMRSGTNTANSTNSSSANAAASGSEGVTVHQQQPLQARSSNSGTSVKRSDNISQSSYPVGDVSSDKAFQSNSVWGTTKTSTDTTTQQQLAPGQLTNAFAQLKREGGATTSSSTANTKETQSSSARRSVIPRRLNADGSIQTGLNATQAQTSASARGVATRASGRQTRKGDQQRAVKDSSVTVTQVKDQGSNMAKPQAFLQANNANQDNNRAEQLLKPTKQSQSEQLVMRQTRSKSKAKQQDTVLNEEPKQEESHCSISHISNGQSPGVGGNLEKITNTSIHLRPTKRLENEISQPWQGEESKLLSPRSLNSTLIVPGAEKPINHSFRINDSTDSLMENPLTTVIKQFQNLRTNALNAQLTGKNKPTIQQFLQKFEKEMQYLEDQYQAQQQAREEQMRLFEQHYGNRAPTDDNLGMKTGGADMKDHQFLPPYASQYPNDQQACMNLPKVSSQFCDTLMVQDTSTLGPMAPLDQTNNSFVSAVHGPNHVNASEFGGVVSEVTSSEVYESFSFNQNSMMAFYPRQVRKILTRRKTTNSATTIMHELRDLKAPKHKQKVIKSMSKMQSLAVCQMNMMQILLQKISRRSKVIRKQEKIVNDNLKRKRILLEHENFDLMGVIRKSLEEEEGLNQGLSGEKNSQQMDISQMQSQSQLRAKINTHTAASDFNSRCLSTSGTKYYGDQPQTQSVIGSTAALPCGEDNTSMDGCQSRKQNRMLSGQDACLSLAESIQQSPQKNQLTASQKQEKLPKQVRILEQAHQAQRVAAEDQINQAVRLSEINDSSFPNTISKSQQNVTQAQRSQLVTVEDIASQSAHFQVFPDERQECQEVPPFGYYQNEQQEDLNILTPKKGSQPQLSKVANYPLKQSETPHQEHRLAALMDTDDIISQQAIYQDDEIVNQRSNVNQVIRKNQTTTQGRRKRKSALTLDQKQQQPPSFNLEGKLADSSYTTPLSGPNVKTQHLPNGQIALTIKMKDKLDAQAADSTTNVQINLAEVQPALQKINNVNKTTKKSQKTNPKSDLRVQTKFNTEPHVQPQFADHNIHQSSEVQNAGVQYQEQKQLENQSQLSPLRDFAHENKNQANATNIGVQNTSVQHQALMHSHSMPPMNDQFVGAHLPVDAFGNLTMMNTGFDQQHDHIMIGAHDDRQGIFNEFTGVDTAQMPNAPVGHFQPLVNPGQMTDLAMHRSQSVMLPQTQLYVPQNSYMDPNGINMAGQAQFEHHFQHAAHYEQVQQQTQSGVPNTNVGVHNKQQTDVLNFFDESAQELSSIEHSAAAVAVDSYGYQTGPNPYEQAKRQYLKKSMMAQQNNPNQSQSIDQGQSVSNIDHLKNQQPFERVNNFVSPMVGLQQLSQDQHTPQNKQLVQDGQPGPINMVDRTGTPSHFLSGCEVVTAQTGLGRGTVLAQHTLNADHQQRQQESHQLSVGRLCGDPFNMSAGGFNGERHQDSSVAGHQSLMRGNFGNTPAGVMSIGQQCISDAHRQHLSVSGWNLDEPSAQQNQDGGQDHQQNSRQIYQGLPEHPYM